MQHVPLPIVFFGGILVGLMINDAKKRVVRKRKVYVLHPIDDVFAVPGISAFRHRIKAKQELYKLHGKEQEYCVTICEVDNQLPTSQEFINSPNIDMSTIKKLFTNWEFLWDKVIEEIALNKTDTLEKLISECEV